VVRARDESHRILKRALELSGEPSEAAVASFRGGSVQQTIIAGSSIEAQRRWTKESVRVDRIGGGARASVETDDWSESGLQRLASSLSGREDVEPVAAESSSEFQERYAALPSEDVHFDAMSAKSDDGDLAYIASRILGAVRPFGLNVDGSIWASVGALAPDGALGAFATLDREGTFRHQIRTDAGLEISVSHSDGPRFRFSERSASLFDLDVAESLERAMRYVTAPGRPRRVRKGAYDLVWTPEAMANLLRALAGSFCRGRLKDVSCATEFVACADREHPDRPTPWLSDDLPATPRVVIFRGGQAGLLSDGFVDRLHHLVMEKGGCSVDALWSELDVGIVVSAASQISICGTRRLVLEALIDEGFWVERGEVVAPIRSLRFQVDLSAFLASLDGLSDELADVRGVCVPWARFRSVHV
jgi:predicted Zn-dependent protease